MHTITFAGQNYCGSTQASILETLLQANVNIPNACREGVCQSCMMRSVDACPPALAQKGLKDTLRQQNYFLACRCRPEQDMTVALPDQEGDHSTAIVKAKTLLSRDIVKLVLTLQEPFDFYAGQFVNLKRGDGLTRSYSIANIPGQDNTLEFHIRRLPNGRFSVWVHDKLAVDDTLMVSEAKGTCYYLPGKFDQPLMLVGTGSGLAPLVGIVNEALLKGHSGPIRLYHGSRDPDGLYMVEEMRALAQSYANFDYVPCVSGNHSDSGFAKGRAHDIALSSTENLSGWRVYLCGHPDMVSQSKKMAYLKGASLNDIHADAFYTTPVGNPRFGSITLPKPFVLSLAEIRP